MTGSDTLHVETTLGRQMGSYARLTLEHRQRVLLSRQATRRLSPTETLELCAVELALLDLDQMIPSGTPLSDTASVEHLATESPGPAYARTSAVD